MVEINEHDVLRFRPADAREPNSNDVRSFVYEWFARFEHLSGPEYFLAHLDDGDMEIRFPEQTLRSHADFLHWHEDIVRHIPWEFHDVRNLEVGGDPEAGFHVSFEVGWYGEKAGGEEIDPKYADSWAGTGSLIAMAFHQEWDVRVRDGSLFINRYVVTPVGG